MTVRQLLDAVEDKTISEAAASMSDQVRALAAAVYPEGHKRALAAVQGAVQAFNQSLACPREATRTSSSCACPVEQQDVCLI